MTKVDVRSEVNWIHQLGVGDFPRSASPRISDVINYFSRPRPRLSILSRDCIQLALLRLLFSMLERSHIHTTGPWRRRGVGSITGRLVSGPTTVFVGRILGSLRQEFTMFKPERLARFSKGISVFFPSAYPPSTWIPPRDTVWRRGLYGIRILRHRLATIRNERTICLKRIS